MSAAASFVGSVDAEALAGRYLGPATVVQANANGVRCSLPSGALVEPRLALAYPITPAEGDTLLLIGQDERYFVIGVVATKGATHLAFRGDVELRSVDGKVSLHGERGVELRGQTIELRSQKLRVLAEKASEVFGSVFTQVKDLLSVHAGASDAVVHGQWSQRAEHASITSEEVVTINGREVHLG
jgi:hypothetical protein